MLTDEKLEKCLTCDGRGFLAKWGSDRAFTSATNSVTTEQCPVCRGSGSVWTIRPIFPVLVIRCKDCFALFYANSQIKPEDVLDIIKYSKDGHTPYVVDAAVVRVEMASCTCKKQNP